MSAYATHSTTFTEAAYLVAALRAAKFTVEVHEQAQTLYDYHGRPRPQKASIIIRRQHTGIAASNDIGFYRESDGTYKAIISEYDRGAKFSDRWLNSLKQSYQEQRQMSIAKQRGYHFAGREEIQTATGKEVKLRFTIR